MRHSLRETWSGLRRNLAMTIAVVVTMAVSLSLLGLGVMTALQVDKARASLYERISITVFLCTEKTQGGRCEPGKATTDAQREQIQRTLEANPEVSEVVYESKEVAYAEFLKVYADSPVAGTRTVEDMQDAFRVKFDNPENYAGVVAEAQGLQGVQAVQDLASVLDPMFTWLRGIQWATIIMSSMLLLAGALQIANTIRMAAFTRRREIGIMRLVGASNVYILLPFLLESLIAAAIGVVAAGAALVAAYWFIIDQTARPAIPAIEWIGAGELLVALGTITAVGIALAIVPTLLATRKYLRI